MESEGSDPEKADAQVPGRLGERVVHGGERRVEPQRELEVGSVVHGQAISLRQGERCAPGVRSGRVVDEDGPAQQQLSSLFGILKRHPPAPGSEQEAVGDLQWPMLRDVRRRTQQCVSLSFFAARSL